MSEVLIKVSQESEGEAVSKHAELSEKTKTYDHDRKEDNTKQKKISEACGSGLRAPTSKKNFVYGNHTTDVNKFNKRRI